MALFWCWVRLILDWAVHQTLLKSRASQAGQKPNISKKNKHVRYSVTSSINEKEIPVFKQSRTKLHKLVQSLFYFECYLVTLRLEWMCLSLSTWTDRLCSQREQHSPVGTEKDADRFSTAAWLTTKKQGTGPEHSTKTQNNISFSSLNKKKSFKAKQQMFIRKSV